MRWHKSAYCVRSSRTIWVIRTLILSVGRPQTSARHPLCLLGDDRGGTVISPFSNTPAGVAETMITSVSDDVSGRRRERPPAGRSLRRDRVALSRGAPTVHANADTFAAELENRQQRPH